MVTPVTGCRVPVWLTAALLLAAPACTSTRGEGPGLWHRVVQGETVWGIARGYGADVTAVLQVNDIREPRKLSIGRRLWIPSGRLGAGQARGGGPPRHARTRNRDALPPVLRGRVKRGPAPGGSRCAAWGQLSPAFAWPLRGRVSSAFGRRRGRHHNGIDIAARAGTQVRAAASGKVIFSGRLGSYGRIIVLQHGGGWASVYAHNRRNLVARGRRVRRRQIIAEVGATGSATGPHLHFEIRRGDTPTNPLLCLP